MKYLLIIGGLALLVWYFLKSKVTPGSLIPANVSTPATVATLTNNLTSTANSVINNTPIIQNGTIDTGGGAAPMVLPGGTNIVAAPGVYGASPIVQGYGVDYGDTFGGTSGLGSGDAEVPGIMDTAVSITPKTRLIKKVQFSALQQASFIANNLK